MKRQHRQTLQALFAHPLPHGLRCSQVEALLLNILPAPIAERLKRGETLIADDHAEVTILFADIVGSTSLGEQIDPEDLADLLNGAFAMSEMALTAARKARLQVMVENAEPGAQAAMDLHDNPTKFLSTVQIGITLVGVLSGAVSGATLGVRLSGIEIADVPNDEGLRRVFEELARARAQALLVATPALSSPRMSRLLAEKAIQARLPVMTAQPNTAASAKPSERSTLTTD